MKTRLFTMFVLTVGLALLMSGCGPSVPSPTPSPAPPTATPIAKLAATPTAQPTPTETPIPALTATAQAFQASVQATATAAFARIALVQEKLGQAIACQTIPADRLLLTSPVPLPAEIGEARDGQAVIFRVSEGTIVRAPIGGSIRLGPWEFRTNIDYFTITVGDKQVLVGVPRGNYQILLEGYDPTKYFTGNVRRGDPIARIGPPTILLRPSETTGLEGPFSVIVMVETPDYKTIPLGVTGDLWYGGIPAACSDWLPEPTPAAVVQATPTPTATQGPVLAIPTPLPYTATVPTPTGRIAFLALMKGQSQEDIFLYDLTTRNLQQLTHGEWELNYPSVLGWFPDGQRLVFTTLDRKLVVFDPETGQGQEIPNLVRGSNADWSPDGSHFASVSEEAIYVADAGNLNPQQVFKAKGRIDNSSSSWSPDSQRIVFAMQRPDVASNEIYVISASGGTPEQLTDFYTKHPSQPPFKPGALVWSPDGSKVAFSLVAGKYPNTQTDICVLTVSDRQWTCFGKGKISPYGALYWLPDSQRLVFHVTGYGGSLGDGEILLLDVLSDQIINLTHHPEDDELPYWYTGTVVSPGGHFLVFTSDRDDWRGEVYILHIESGQLVARLTVNFARERYPVWSFR